MCTPTRQPQKPETVLYCRTTDNGWGFEYARLRLTPERASTLLSYRDLIAPLAAHDRGFYGIEFFDGLVLFGDVSPDDYVEHGFWVEDVHKSILFKEERSSCHMLHVTESGVLWSGHPKHGEGHFETELISWADLERVAAGEADVFTAYTVAEGDEET